MSGLRTALFVSLAVNLLLVGVVGGAALSNYRQDRATAQKAVAQLTALGLLQVHPGIGTRVAQPARVSRAASTAELRPQVADLVLEARRLGVTLTDLQDLLEAEWQRLDPSTRGTRRG